MAMSRTITVEFRRHSFTKKGDDRGHGSHLSPAGVAAARRLGETLESFSYVVASEAPRTLETAIAMGFAVDELIAMPSPVETGHVDFHAWRGWGNPFLTLRDLAGSATRVEAYMAEQVARVRDLAHVAGRAGDAAVLVVGHGGWLEATVAGLVSDPETGRLGGSFWHLDGVRLTLAAGGEVMLDGVDRHPRP